MKKVDFYDLGRKDVNDIYIVVERRRKEIEEKYGKDAAEQYLLGVASEIGRFSTMDIDGVNISDIEKGTKNFGIENKRNNSYFGGKGISTQYNRIDDYGIVSYIDPYETSSKTI